MRALSDSRKELAAALGISEQPSKYEIIWLAYCNVELGIALLKLARDESSERTGSLRKLRRTRKSLLPLNCRERIDKELRSASVELAESICCFEENARYEESLEHARRARDTLKIILLGNEKN